MKLKRYAELLVALRDATSKTQMKIIDELEVIIKSMNNEERRNADVIHTKFYSVKHN